MKLVFVDTLYWVARLNDQDPWYPAARQMGRLLTNVRRLTTEEVLIETLNALSGGGMLIRREAVALVQQVRGSMETIVLPQSESTFTAGLDLYRRRLDKGYSLTDCISMNAMRERGITDVLTNDHHFEQEGFNVLIRR